MQLVRTRRTGRNYIIVFFGFHTLDIYNGFFCGIFHITHICCRTSAASLSERHCHLITDGIHIGNDGAGKIDIDKVQKTAGKYGDRSLRIFYILLNCREYIPERYRSNRRKAPSLGKARQEHRQVPDHRLPLCKGALCYGSNSEHGMEELSVGYRIQCEFLYNIRLFRHSLFPKLHNHFGNIKPAAADLIAPSALQTNTLNLRRPFFRNKEVCKQCSNTARIYI